MEKITRRDALIEQVAEIKAELADAMGWATKLAERTGNAMILMDDVMQNLVLDKNANLDAILDTEAEPLPFGNEQAEARNPGRARQAPQEQPARTEPRARSYPGSAPERQPEPARTPQKEPEQAVAQKEPNIIEKVLNPDQKTLDRQKERKDNIAKLEEELRRLQGK